MLIRYLSTLVLFIALAAPRVLAQGCILIRESAPVIGSPRTVYLNPGEWSIDVMARGSTADRHYSRDV